MRWVSHIFAVAIVLAASMGQAQAPAGRLALVIGVGDYGRERAVQEAAGFVVPPALANAVRDAQIVADALEAKGFAVVRVENPDKRTLLSAVNAFATRLTAAGPDAVGVFYFAGHGAQGRPALERDIDNYLIPLGADLATEVDLESEALALSRVSATLRPAARGAMVLILDACRDFALPAASRSGLVTRGLAEARAAPGTIIAYATAPGATALDALPGARNGPYAGALAAEVRAAQGARLEDVFIAVRNKVLDQTHGMQVPWENGSLRRAVTLGVSLVDRSELPSPTAPKTRPGERFTECAACPEMVVIPGGTFVMGSPASEEGRADNEAQRTVAIRPFAAGRTEVTFAQWDACAAAGGCKQRDGSSFVPDADGSGRGQQPVRNVSWDDTSNYLLWLNNQVGGHAYRLLAEAEWEFAARAGSTTTYPWGSNPNDACAYANGADVTVMRDNPFLKAMMTGLTCNDGWEGTAPVGSFQANAFGLYDMQGNVGEWVEDCVFPAANGSDMFSNCFSRYFRGGGATSHPSDLRVAAKGTSMPNLRLPFVGFRVAREIR